MAKMKFLKQIRKLTILLAILLAVAYLYLYIFNPNLRDASISGKLFIVNKASSSITVFDLENWKHITEIPVAVEPHEVTALQGLKKVIVTNYGNENQIGRTLTVIDGVSNTLEKIIFMQYHISGDILSGDISLIRYSQAHSNLSLIFYRIFYTNK